MEDVDKILNNETLKKHLDDIKKYHDEYIKRVNKKVNSVTANKTIKKSDVNE